MAKRVGGCTRSPGGYVRWYKGRTRFVCSLDTPAAAVEDAWIARKKGIDADAGAVVRRRSGRMALRELLSGFFDACDHRVKTGKPAVMSERTAHNYTTDLNEFGEIVGGATPIDDIGPDQFAAYHRKISHLKASGYASKVAHVMTLFNWAVEMEYVDRVRFGADFTRPAKREIRDQRIPRRRSFTPAEVAKMLDGAGPTMQAMIALGITGALINSEVAYLERSCVDLDTGVIDFRRRKTGKVRRVIPLPPAVAKMLKGYRRPEPADAANDPLFFLTEDGRPYVRMSAGGQMNTITVLFNRLAADCGVKNPSLPADGRSFAGLRTTFCNLAPAGYRDEVEHLTGHAHGTVLLDHYLEDVGLDRLRHVVDHVWNLVNSERADSKPKPAQAFATKR